MYTQLFFQWDLWVKHFWIRHSSGCYKQEKWQRQKRNISCGQILCRFIFIKSCNSGGLFSENSPCAIGLPDRNNIPIVNENRTTTIIQFSCYSSMLTVADADRVIEMAWEDRTPFEAIEMQFGLSEAQVIELMRKSLKRKSFQLWRELVNSGISQKHLRKRNPEIDRFKCTRQRQISLNKISKR